MPESLTEDWIVKAVSSLQAGEWLIWYWITITAFLPGWYNLVIIRTLTIFRYLSSCLGVGGEVVEVEIEIGPYILLVLRQTELFLSWLDRNRI